MKEPPKLHLEKLSREYCRENFWKVSHLPSLKVNSWKLLFYALLSLNMVLGILAALKELFATECISVVLTVVAIISCFTIDHHLTVCLTLLIIFLLSFILSLLLYLKPKILITFAEDEEQEAEDNRLSSERSEHNQQSQTQHSRRITDRSSEAEENVWCAEPNGVLSSVLTYTLTKTSMDHKCGSFVIVRPTAGQHLKLMSETKAIVWPTLRSISNGYVIIVYIFVSYSGHPLRTARVTIHYYLNVNAWELCYRFPSLSASGICM
jgi:hypothetical protein